MPPRAGRPEAEHVRAALREYLRHTPPVDADDDPLWEPVGTADDPAGERRAGAVFGCDDDFRVTGVALEP